MYAKGGRSENADGDALSRGGAEAGIETGERLRVDDRAVPRHRNCIS